MESYKLGCPSPSCTKLRIKAGLITKSVPYLCPYCKINILLRYKFLSFKFYKYSEDLWTKCSKNIVKLLLRTWSFCSCLDHNIRFETSTANIWFQIKSLWFTELPHSHLLNPWVGIENGPIKNGVDSISPIWSRQTIF